MAEDKDGEPLANYREGYSGQDNSPQDANCEGDELPLGTPRL